MTNFRFQSATAVFGVACLLAAPGVMGQTPTLVINEIDYDQIGTDTDEFVEILNVSGAPVSLAGKELVFINGANNATYLRINLAPAGSLAPGAYLVVCPATVQATLPVGTPSILFSVASNNIQNGAPDGVCIIDNNTGTLVDSFCYEGAMTAGTVTGFQGGAPFSLVHGTALPGTLFDSNAAPASFARIPNGQNSGDDVADWQLVTAPTPGVANSSGCASPAVSANPVTINVCPGATATFRCTAAGTPPFSFDWTFNGTPVDFSDPRITVATLPGDLTSELTITNVSSADTGPYQVRVTNACGGPVASAIAGLMFAAADIGQQGGIPPGDGLYDNNDFVVFITAFFAQQAVADIGQQGGTLGPDSQWDNNDFVVFINLFFAGCP